MTKRFLMGRGPARVIAAAALCLSSALVSPATAAPTAPAAARFDLPEPPSADVARDELAELDVEAPHSMTGYSRAKFPHWATQQGQCDTRETVLARDGRDVRTDAQCRAVAGSWLSPYDGKQFAVAGQLDIDHVVPLANAWRSGADKWDTPRRKRFANDLDSPQLVAVSAASNRQKGDQSPDQWKPPLKSYWCTYARAWTHVKHTYDLNVTKPEQEALVDMLDTCGS
ncbi:HNH endonuclease family protein [Streptomyces sp. NPDC049555]|uniref:HNH endonuclease family protein n=1 Tax=Streptomyces sp. NPDC049555 TaxID=3154930 RepID=UPI003446DE4D